jgi:CDP-diacylglycerol--glycerol-3-phosphate 3-phosphatidyltransferase
MPEPIWNVPNLLSLSRLPLAILLFVCIGQQAWLAALLLFLLASLTDWLDGWWARRYQQFTALGRSLDPLTDKVLIGGTFIYLIPYPEPTHILPWMVTTIIGRELLITGLRGMVETAGKKFGADWFGKLKTILQCVVLIGILLLQTLRSEGWLPAIIPGLEQLYLILLAAMLFATVGSGIQYVVKAVKLLR